MKVEAPSDKDLLVFGWLVGPFFAVLGVVARWHWDVPTASVVFWVLALVVPALFLFAPKTRLPIYRGWMTAVAPIGFIVSRVLLGLVFFLVVLPLGLVMRLFGRDPMTRRIDPGSASYWQPYSSDPARERYFRQY